MLKITLICTRGARVNTRVESTGVDVPITFGRQPDNTVVFDRRQDANASSHHARIDVDDGRFILTDLGSTNGTFVTDGATESRVRKDVLLANGMQVEFGKGGPLYLVEIEGDEAAVPKTNFIDISAWDLPPEAEAAPSAAELPSHALDAPLATAVTKPSSGRAWIVGALILVILGAAAGGGWWLWDRSQREAAREKATLKAESETREAEKTRLAAEKSRLADEKSRLAAEKAALDKDLESTRTSLTAAQTSAEQAKAALADTAQKVKLLENVAAAREQSAEEAMAENERLAEQAAVHSREFDAELRAKEDALKTAEERAGVLKTVLSEYDKSLFTLLTVRPDTKAVTEGCVAFLVAPKLLASTAACGQALADGKATGLWTMARIVRDPGRTFAVASWRLDAEAGLSVIELDTETTELPKPFVLAEPDAMAARLVAGRAAFAVRSAAHDGKVDIDVTVQRLEANTAELPAGAAEPTEPGQPSRPTDPAARASAASRLRLQAIATPPPVGAPIIDADARVVGIVGGTPPGQAGAADQMALSAAGLAKLLKP